ncbi:hypothetical protein ISS03_04215 [Patescibacteria group bacterium]|nr:hypothetical protein [Patescibacteria group bacterium]
MLKIITPTITMFEILAVITPIIFSFIVSTTMPVVDATSASTAAKAGRPTKKVKHAMVATPHTPKILFLSFANIFFTHLNFLRKTNNTPTLNPMNAQRIIDLSIASTIKGKLSV